MLGEIALLDGKEGLLAGNTEVWVFVPAMLAGAWLQRQTNRPR